MNYYLLFQGIRIPVFVYPEAAGVDMRGVFWFLIFRFFIVEFCGSVKMRSKNHTTEDG